MLLLCDGCDKGYVVIVDVFGVVDVVDVAVGVLLLLLFFGSMLCIVSHITNRIWPVVSFP